MNLTLSVSERLVDHGIYIIKILCHVKCVFMQIFLDFIRVINLIPKLFTLFCKPLNKNFSIQILQYILLFIIFQCFTNIKSWTLSFVIIFNIFPSHWWYTLQGFNGTLTEPVEREGDRFKERELTVHPELKQPLAELCSDPKTTVVVLSGSCRTVLDEVILSKFITSFFLNYLILF